MNVLIIDRETLGLNLAIRAQNAGHHVRLWLPRTSEGQLSCVGDGMVEKPPEWKPHMSWADLVVLTGNDAYHADLEPFFRAGYPIIGARREAAELEIDRVKGQMALEKAGIKTLHYDVFSNLDKAAAFVRATKKIYVCKPTGRSADKALSCVSRDPADMIFRLQRMKQRGFKGDIMLQEFVPGIEMGVAAWFGPGGFNEMIEENWEEKKFMTDGLGHTTGEQGTTLRYVRKSKLFNMLLKPLTEQLHALNYVGDVCVSCIIDANGVPGPTEWTIRMGWPAFNLHMALVQGDPIEWLRDLFDGKDTLRVSGDICVGIVMTHGRYPHHTPGDECEGFPINGITAQNEGNIHWQQVKDGWGPVMIAGNIVESPVVCTAGDYVCVTTGTGSTVKAAQREAYKTAWQLEWPNNRMFRSPDIGARLKRELPLLQEHGFAVSMEY